MLKVRLMHDASSTHGPVFAFPYTFFRSLM
jgi:hypothetical protein